VVVQDIQDEEADFMRNDNERYRLDSTDYQKGIKDNKIGLQPLPMFDSVDKVY
tara:strand:+ start:129 stop:287 length:159 start_codon:yes stop_codon:yes gene_type:complete